MSVIFYVKRRDIVLNVIILNQHKIVANFMLIVFAVMLFNVVGPTDVQANSSGNVNFLLGVKNLEEDDWEPVERQTEFGINVDFKQSNWPISLAFGFSTSYDDDTVEGLYIEGITSEFYFGIKKVFNDHANVRPYMGVGLASIYAEADVELYGITVTEDDSALGIWFGGGVYFTIAPHLNLGFDVRYSDAEVTLAGYDFEAGGLHYGVLIGYNW